MKRHPIKYHVMALIGNNTQEIIEITSLKGMTYKDFLKEMKRHCIYYDDTDWSVLHTSAKCINKLPQGGKK